MSASISIYFYFALHVYFINKNRSTLCCTNIKTKVIKDGIQKLVVYVFYCDIQIVSDIQILMPQNAFMMQLKRTLLVMHRHAIALSFQ